MSARRAPQHDAARTAQAELWRLADYIGTRLRQRLRLRGFARVGEIVVLRRRGCRFFRQRRQLAKVRHVERERLVESPSRAGHRRRESGVAQAVRHQTGRDCVFDRLRREIVRRPERIVVDRRRRDGIDIFERRIVDQQIVVRRRLRSTCIPAA